MDTVIQDLRYAVRTLAKQQGVTAVAIICLALGIGVNTVIFSCLNAILLRPFPYADPNALVVITEDLAREARRSGGALSYPDYVDYAASTKSFVSMGAYASRTFTLTGTAEPERVEGARISASMFPTLGIAPARGRGLLPADDRDGAPRVALISDGLWERRFNRDSQALGRTIEVDGGPATIVGVMPPDVRFPGRADLWLPHARSVTDQRDNHYLQALGRLAPGATLARARVELETVGHQLAARYPDSNQGWGPIARTLRDAEVGDVRPVLLIMQAAVSFVLLIACANVANLLMARGTARHREIAIRTTLGAVRSRIVRQLLTESVVLALAAGVLGTLLAGWGLDLVVAMLPDSIPSWMQFTIDARVLAFTLLISLTTGIVFGLVPALQISRPDLSDALKDGSRGAGAGRQSRRLRSVLVVAEVSLSLVLLIGASLMMKSFLRLQSVDPGFDYRGSLAMQIAFTGPRYDSTAARWTTLDRVATEVATLPGVVGAAAVSLTPLTTGNAVTGFFVDGEPLTAAGAHDAEIRSITAGYFRTLKIVLARGRTFTPQEVTAGSPVAVVNETLAARYWPNEDAIGKRMRWGVTTADPLLTVVGVVADVKQRQLGAPMQPQIYVPYTQYPYRTMSLLVNTEGDPAALATAVRAKVRELAPGVPLYGLETMREIYARSVWQQRLYGTLFTSFAAIALMLAAAGVYSVIAYSVTQRLHEIGVRMALGAQQSDVFRLVVAGGARLAVIGVVIGTVGAFAATRVLATLLFGVSPTDPLVFSGMAALLLVTATIASYLPARRAASLDPVNALRND
jgi:putative ABC transport system permease protein